MLVFLWLWYCVIFKPLLIIYCRMVHIVANFLFSLGFTLFYFPHSVFCCSLGEAKIKIKISAPTLCISFIWVLFADTFWAHMSTENWTINWNLCRMYILYIMLSAVFSSAKNWVFHRWWKVVKIHLCSREKWDQWFKYLVVLLVNNNGHVSVVTSSSTDIPI